MSRGPGKWQRAVLEAVDAAIDPETGFAGWVSVDAIGRGAIRSTLTRSQREAIRRAMRTLAAGGEIVLDHAMVDQPTKNTFYWNDTLYRELLFARRPPPDEQVAAEAAAHAEMERRIAKLVASLGGRPE